MTSYLLVVLRGQRDGHDGGHLANCLALEAKLAMVVETPAVERAVFRHRQGVVAAPRHLQHLVARERRHHLRAQWMNN
eukprot:1185621-Prorocentrum_minimum.AAC.1